MEAPVEKTEFSEGEGKESVYSTASRTKKYIATAIVCYCTFAFGAGNTFLGPTIVDFSNKFDTDIDNISIVFTISMGSYLVGALVNAILNRFVNRQVFVVTLLAISSAALFAFPHVGSIGLFFMLAAFLGIAGGGYDSAQIAWIIDIWRHEAAPFILTQHFFYSLGTVVPPLVLSPFLTGEAPEIDDTKCLDKDAIFTTTTTPNSLFSSTTGEIETEKSQMWIPFSVGGFLVVGSILVQFVLYFVLIKPSNSKSQEVLVATKTGGESNTTKDTSQSKFKLPEKRQMILTILSAICLAFYQACEVGTLQFLPTFAHFSSVRLSEKEGADLLTGLTSAYCFFRLIGIFIVLKVAPHIILFVNFALLVLANLILLFFGDDNVTMLWVGSVLFGAALSTLFPAYFAYIEKYLFISDTVAGILLVFAGGVGALYPIIVGGSVECTPKVMIYANLLCVGVIVSCFAIIFWLTHLNAEKKEDGKNKKEYVEIEPNTNVISNNVETSTKG